MCPIIEANLGKSTLECHPAGLSSLVVNCLVCLNHLSDGAKDVPSHAPSPASLSSSPQTQKRTHFHSLPVANLPVWPQSSRQWGSEASRTDCGELACKPQISPREMGNTAIAVYSVTYQVSEEGRSCRSHRGQCKNHNHTGLRLYKDGWEGRRGQPFPLPPVTPTNFHPLGNQHRYCPIPCA